MSKEATGENGAVLGSSDYWNRVNRATFFGTLMQRPSETNYHETLRKVGEPCWRHSGRDLRRLAGTHKRHSQYIL